MITWNLSGKHRPPLVRWWTAPGRPSAVCVLVLKTVFQLHTVRCERRDVLVNDSREWQDATCCHGSMAGSYIPVNRWVCFKRKSTGTGGGTVLRGTGTIRRGTWLRVQWTIRGASAKVPLVISGFVPSAPRATRGTLPRLSRTTGGTLVWVPGTVRGMLLNSHQPRFHMKTSNW